MENKPTIREAYYEFANPTLKGYEQSEGIDQFYPKKYNKQIADYWLNKIKEVVGEVDVPYEKMTEGQIGWFNGRNDERQRILKEFGIIK